MKKLVIGVVSTAAILVATATPALADVVRPGGATTGRPVAVDSNTGSVQGQQSRSDVGTANKLQHDGYRVLW